ncbi:pumilio-like 12-like isoform X1 [Melia azedarach]|uniref:Pumilio-like 12-like isoform X1 n=1 Tax=Melia azedarach TaxID=155640 RepID=A0ACC1YJM9_MELAZ|nr:pumilio-like 12-like isoform X1 [Melia azedarach]
MENLSAEYENLLHSLENLRVYNPTVEPTTSADTSFSSLNQLQQQQNQRPAPVLPVPLYSESSIWAVQGLRGREKFSGSNLQYETVSGSDFQFSGTNAGFQANPFQDSKFQLTETSDDVLLMAQDQEGSQYLKEKLFSGDSRFTSKIFQAVYRFPFQLMCHQYGRFVFGKLIESCSDHQLTQITLKITSHDREFLDASIDRLGSASIKKMIRVLAKEPLISYVMSILNRLFKFIMVNKFGSSIIIQCLESRYSRENVLIYQAALEHCLTLACHEQGCIYLNNFIDEMIGPRRRQILHLICMNSPNLSADIFGNYVLQHVLKLENLDLIKKIRYAMTGHYIDLSMQKGGSFVVQQCLKYEEMVQYIVEEFLNSNRIFQVANDRYGNYVIQTALEETMRVNRFNLHYRLIMKLQPHSAALQFGYGKNIYNLITRETNLISEFTTSMYCAGTHKIL